MASITTIVKERVRKTGIEHQGQNSISDPDQNLGLSCIFSSGMQEFLVSASTQSYIIYSYFTDANVPGTGLAILYYAWSHGDESAAKYNTNKTCRGMLSVTCTLNDYARSKVGENARVAKDADTLKTIIMKLSQFSSCYHLTRFKNYTQLPYQSSARFVDHTPYVRHRYTSRVSITYHAMKLWSRYMSYFSCTEYV